MVGSGQVGSLVPTLLTPMFAALLHVSLLVMLRTWKPPQTEADKLAKAEKAKERKKKKKEKKEVKSENDSDEEDPKSRPAKKNMVIFKLLFA